MKGKRFNHHRTSARLSATQATVHQRIRAVLVIVMSHLTRRSLLPASDGVAGVSFPQPKILHSVYKNSELHIFNSVCLSTLVVGATACG